MIIESAIFPLKIALETLISSVSNPFFIGCIILVFLLLAARITVELIAGVKN